MLNKSVFTLTLKYILFLCISTQRRIMTSHPFSIEHENKFEVIQRIHPYNIKPSSPVNNSYYFPLLPVG